MAKPEVQGLDDDAIDFSLEHDESIVEDMMLAERRRRSGTSISVVGRLAMAFAPLSSAFYDLQMTLGKGVRHVQHRVVLPNYPNNTPPLRVAFLSDFHYGPTSGGRAARQAWTLARRMDPDILLLGGDFFYADERGMPTLLRELRRWKQNPPRAGIYACLGNHDYLANTEALKTCLQACGVRVLLNEAVELPYPWNGVWLVGSDDTRCGDPQPELALAEVPNGAPAIMLAHSPDICEFPVVKRCGLTLCGHTHGGQIRLPNREPLYMPSEWGKQYTEGMHRHSGNWVFVSRGIGTVGLPLRLWAPPDVAEIEIIGRGGVWRNTGR